MHSHAVAHMHQHNKKMLPCSLPGIKQRLLLAPLSEHDVVRVVEPDADRHHAPSGIRLAGYQVYTPERLLSFGRWCRLRGQNAGRGSEFRGEYGEYWSKRQGRGGCGGLCCSRWHDLLRREPERMTSWPKGTLTFAAKIPSHRGIYVMGHKIRKKGSLIPFSGKPRSATQI